MQDTEVKKIEGSPKSNNGEKALEKKMVGRRVGGHPCRGPTPWTP